MRLLTGMDMSKGKICVNDILFYNLVIILVFLCIKGKCQARLN